MLDIKREEEEPSITHKEKEACMCSLEQPLAVKGEASTSLRKRILVPTLMVLPIKQVLAGESPPKMPSLAAQ